MTRRLFTLAAIFAATCMACGVAYRVIGVEIDSNGTLREPFALIPIGYLAGAGAVVSGGAALISKQRRR